VRRPHAPRASRIRLKTLLVLADAGAVLLATAVCLVLLPLETNGRTDGRAALAALLIVPALWSASLRGQQLYAARRVVSRTEEFRRIVHAAGASTAALALFAYLLDITTSRAWLVVLPGLAIVTLTSEREVARRVFGRLRRSGKLARDVIVVGANDEAIELAAQFDSDPSVGYRIVGFVTDRPIDSVNPSLQSRVLGGVDRTATLVAATGAVGVVIASTAVTTAVSNRLARTLTEQGIHVELTSTLRDIVIERLTVAEIGQFPTLYVEPVHRGGWRAVAKRCFDVTVALSVLVAVSPVLAVVAVLVRRSSDGPVFFRQVRVGKDGKTFELIKFRTMVSDAESQLEALLAHNEASGPLFKMTDDPRVTRIGGCLRRTSIDELPQLWNVLRGEMSLVGPRPALPSEARTWEPALHDRLRVKPGITGMWQVNGRSTASFDQYTRLDLFYVDNWSLLTDLAILVRTLPAVVSRRGAH